MKGICNSWGLGLAWLIIWTISLPEAAAQNPSRQDIDLDKFILDLFPVQDDDLNYEDIYETLFQLYRNPLDLNAADREDLQSFFILSELQINALLDYRQRYGRLLTVYELQAVPNFDIATIQKILPFVEVRDSGLASDTRSLWQRMRAEHDNHYLLMRYDRVPETKRGYTSDATDSQRYLGSPDRLYARYRLSHTGDFSMGFTVKKDAGEQITYDPSTRRYGMGFYSYHFFLQNKGRWKSIALGDYQLQIGQGLLLAAGFTIGKGAETVQTLRRPNLGLRPYTSALESGFLRGAAATYQLGRFDITGFVSHIRRDGALSEDEGPPNDTLDTGFDNADLFIETLRVTGLHRTAREVAGKGIFSETTYGGNIAYRNRAKTLEIGTTVLNTQYNIPFRRNFASRRDSLRYQFEFSGKQNMNIGVNFTYQYQNISFFGEAARSSSGGIGYIGGLVASLSPQVDFAFSVRDYARDFHTFYGSALGEGTRNINERGYYWGFKYKPNRQWLFTAYYDRFVFPWLRYRIDAPSEGDEWLMRLTYNFSRKISTFVQVRQETKARNLSSDDSETALRTVLQGTRRQMMFNFDYQAERIFSYRTRIQVSEFEYNYQITRGFALVNDVELDFKKKLVLNARFAIFDTDDFDNRQYIPERDVLWAFSVPPYSGRGYRYYLMAKYKIGRKIDVWLRWAQFHFRNQDTVGSGSEQIASNVRSEVRCQVRVKF